MSEVAAPTGWGVSEHHRVACQGVLRVAAGLGLGSQRAVVLEDWNNTIIRLDPARIVAKVSTSHFRDARLESLERELAVAIHLSARGAPMIQPTQEVSPGPHHWRALTLTLWQYVEPIRGASAIPAQTAAALTLVHEALADFKPPLPRFTPELRGQQLD